jgi:hypothetical protein
MASSNEQSLRAAIEDVEQPFLANKPPQKVRYFKMMKQLPRFFSTYNFNEPQARGDYVYLFYLYMRTIDDIVDGDNLDENDGRSEDDRRQQAVDFLDERRYHLSRERERNRRRRWRLFSISAMNWRNRPGFRLGRNFCNCWVR